MAKSYTNRGKTWELANSWWILLTIMMFGMTSFIAFFYIGSKVKNKRWKYYGFLYLAVVILVFIVNSSDTGASILIILWIVSSVHAFKIRPAYLVQLDVYKANEHQLADKEISKLRKEAEARLGSTKVDQVSKLRQEAEAKFGTQKVQPPQPKKSEAQSTPAAPVEVQAAPPVDAKKIDINTASEAEIAAIPAIGIILAKKVVMKRDEMGGFQSFDQFAQVMGLKEHTLEKISQQVIFSQGESKKVGTRSGRVIDF